MKRVLIITYYWPPAGGPGVQRWLYFVKYFKDFGIEPVVYIPKNPHYPLQDESLLNEVPPDVEIISQPINEPYKFASWFSKKKTKVMSSGIISKKNLSIKDKLLLFIRGNFFIPDARVGWVKPSVTFLQQYLSKNPVEAIITTGPPHSLHSIGMQLKKKVEIQWLADFRDPWTTIHYHDSLRLTNHAKKKHKRLEAAVLQAADTITVTSPTTKVEFTALTSKPIEVITNGFEIRETITPELNTQFSLAHVGSLLSERNPIVLWEVLNELAAEIDGFRDHLEITLAGVIGEEVLTSLTTYGLSENVRNVGYVSHREALQLQHNSQVLLLLEIDSKNTRAIIPGKLFEYLRAKRPILAIGPAGSDIKGIVEQTQSGYYFNFSEKGSLKEAIKQMFEDYSKGTLTSLSTNISKYSRKNLTEQMASLLNGL